jgi:pyruvate dehydrogenase E2 component (dihydrolipoamide acetyltransferase)
LIREIVIPDVGPIKEEPKIIKWLKKEGDPVARGEVLLEVETTKATLEIESTHDGFVRKILFTEGQSAPPLTIIALVGGEDDLVPEVDPYRRAKAPPEAEVRAPSSGAVRAREAKGLRIRASPLAKKLAKERGVDLSALTGSGPGGRITKDDVLQAAEAAPPGEEGRVVPLSPSRMRIAATVSKSFSTIPHVYVTQEIDMEGARAVRERSKGGEEISYDAMFLKAVALSLRGFPTFNAVMEGNQVRVSEGVNVGFVVETDDGIIVPVVRGAAGKSIIEVSNEIANLAKKAREKRLPAEALSGSSFTISNLGMHKVVSFCAIVYPPQIGILAIGGIRRVPCVSGDEVIPGWRAEVTLSCDHRAVDGAEGARFLNDIKARMEDPGALDPG